VTTVYGMEAVRVILAAPVCAIFGHKWGPFEIRCERCHYVDEAKARRLALRFVPLTKAMRASAKSAAEMGRAFAHLKHALQANSVTVSKAMRRIAESAKRLEAER
jgi:hypothetical protein